MKTVFFLIVITMFYGAAFAQENYITSKFDFIPGEKVIFFDDFAAESIGDSPSQWITNGSGEIVTSDKFPGRWFLLTKEGYFMPEIREDFTDNFTVEFDIVSPRAPDTEYVNGIEFFILSASLDEPKNDGQPGNAGWKMKPYNDMGEWSNWSEAREWQGENGEISYYFKPEEKYHISIWVQKQRVRFYANEKKILDLSRGLQANYKYNIFRIEAYGTQPLIANFRLAAGLSDMRNSLSKSGKIISYGIQFDVNSDKLKPESYSTLKAIADLMKEDPSLKLNIVGHTDSDGDEALNRDLSKRRGVSVKNELVSKFSCDASRLETDGKGESEPLADNSTSVGKAKNRRVELIKIQVQPVPAISEKTPSGSTVKQGTLQSGKNIIDISGTWVIDIPRCFSDDSTEFLAKDVIVTIKIDEENISLEKVYTNAWNGEKVNESEKYNLNGESTREDDTYLIKTKLIWKDKKALTISSVASIKQDIVANLDDTYSLTDNGRTLMVHGLWVYPKSNITRNVTTVYTKKD